MTYRYRAKRPFQIAYLVLILIGVLLTLGRWYSVFDPGFTVVNGEVHSHISNLSLSMVVYVGIGYSWLLFGRRFHSIAALGLFLIGGSFVCETLLGAVNTPDVTDALYGTAGALAAHVYLALLHRYGLMERSPGKG